MSTRKRNTKAAAAGERVPVMGRPRLLTQEAVIQAALELSDAHGLESLTVRGLGESLDVAVMTVYSYFKNKDALIQAIADAMLSRIAPPSSQDGDSREELFRFFTELHSLCVEHPSLISLFTDTPIVGPAAHERTEAVLSALIAGGLGHDRAVATYRAAIACTLGYALLRRRSRETPDAEQQLRVRAVRRLSAEEFPALNATAVHLSRRPSLDDFKHTLAAVFDAAASGRETG